MRRYCVLLALVIVLVWLAVAIWPRSAVEPLRLDLPIYGHNRATYYETLETANYKAFAEYDVYYMGHHVLTSPQYKGLVDSVRVYNKDWILLVYVQAFGCNEDWGTVGSVGFYGETYWMIERNDYWMRDYNGNIIRHKPNMDVMMWNQGAEGLADSLGAIYAKYYYASDNVRPYVGYFVDWLTVPYPSSWSVQDRGVIDFNRNKIPYDQDPGDEEQNSRFPRQVSEGFRKHIHDETFLVVPNGGIHHNKNHEFAPLFDGGMNELVNVHYPSGQAQWANAMLDSRYLCADRVDPPLLMFQAGFQDSSGYPTEAQATIAGAVCDFQLGTLDRKLSLGAIKDGPTWAGDTVSVLMSSGARVYAVSDPFIWPYLIIGAAGDTLSRGGGWPRQEYEAPPVEPDFLVQILTNYTEFLSSTYGQTVNLVHLTEWSATATEILAACEEE